MIAIRKRLPIVEAGTSSSGDYGHAGRKGLVGGSEASGLSPELRATVNKVLTNWVYSSMSHMSVQLRRSVNHYFGRDWDADLTPTMIDTWQKGAIHIPLTLYNDMAEGLPAYLPYAASKYDEKYSDGPTLYRGVKGPEALSLMNAKAGDTVHMGPLTSTSQSQEVAQAFAIQNPLGEDTSKGIPVVLAVEGVHGGDVFASEASSPDLFGKDISRQQEVVLLGSKHDWVVTDNYKTFAIDLRDGKEVKMRYVHVKPI